MIVSTKRKDYETMVAKNKTDLEFYVAIPSGSYQSPTFCTCCMSATKNKEKIVGTIVKKGLLTKKKQRLIIEFPLCPECLAHKKAVAKKKYIWAGATLTISIITFCFSLLGGLQYEYAVFLNVGLVALSLLVMGMIFKVAELPPNHSTHENSVQVAAVDPKENLVFFRFSNWQYAKMFARANNSEVKEHPYRNRMSSNQLLKVIARPKRFATIILLVSLLGIIFGRSFFIS